MNKKQKTIKCPKCKGTGKIKVDNFGLTKEERKLSLQKWKEMED